MAILMQWRKLLLISLGCLLGLGCSLFKKSASEILTERHDHMELEKFEGLTNHSSQSSQHVLEWALDSLHSNELLRIWPKGRFTFSIANGFEGEAEKMELSSNLNRSGSVLKTRDSLLLRNAQLKLGHLRKVEDQSAARSTTKTQDPAFWPIGAVVFLIVMGVIIYKLTE